MPDIGISGLQEAQHGNAQMIAAIKPQGAFGQAVKDVLTSLHRYAVTITHRDTGTLASSERMVYSTTENRGMIYIDPGARNPRSGERPAVYAIHEENRGGSHMFFGRTIEEYAERAVMSALQNMYRQFR